MKKTAMIAIVAFVAAFAAPALSSATSVVSVHHFTATMTPTQVVTPANKPTSFPSALAKATGTFKATTSSDGKKLMWNISYANVGKPALVIADIHIGKAGRFGPVLVRLCAPCKPGQRGVTKLKAGYARKLASSSNWITLITDKYPNGVVRGQIRAR